MRIIAGSAGSIRLAVADNSPTRPFLELARGALFNSLGGDVNDATVLDLYAGSGALGLEALSRGAAACVFVEQNAAACAALRQNIEKCGFATAARLVKGDVATVAAGLDGEYDIVFADPPFPVATGWNGADRLSRDIARLVKPGGMLFFRLEDAKTAPPEWTGLVLARDRRYGRSRVCRYGKPESS